MSHAIVTEQIILAGDEPGYYKVKIPGVEEVVEMWCVSADELIIGSKVGIADLDNDHVWSKNNILPNTGVFTYADSRLWLTPESMDDAKANLARAYIYFENWQQSCPTFRRDLITSVIDNDYVRLREYGASRPVKVNYMECNAQAFEVGDYVVVGFENADWNKPVVVGFHEYPQDCIKRFYIRPTIDGRKIYYGGQQLWARYQGTDDPGVWQDTVNRTIKGDSEWDGGSDPRWGVAGPFELELWDEGNVRIVMSRVRDELGVRGDAPFNAFTGYATIDHNEGVPCCWWDPHPVLPPPAGCNTSWAGAVAYWMACTGVTPQVCPPPAGGCPPWHAWMATEGHIEYFYGLDMMFDMWIKDNVNGTHRSYFYHNRLYHNDKENCALMWEEPYDAGCGIRSRCPVSAGIDHPEWSDIPFEAYRNYVEWGHFDGDHGAAITPSPDYYRQAEWLAITIPAAELVSLFKGEKEEVYNPDTGQLEQAYVLERDLPYGLKQVHSDYYFQNVCTEDLLWDWVTLCYPFQFNAFIPTPAWKRLRRQVRRHTPHEHGDVGVLNATWSDYPAGGHVNIF